METFVIHLNFTFKYEKKVVEGRVTHFSNSTADSDFCKNICRLADFAKN